MKYPNPLSIKFGAELKSAIRRTGVRQNAIARHLGMTPPSITQMTSGRMLPTRASMEEIFLYLGLSMVEMGRLRTLWSRCRLGEERECSQLNNRLFSLRCERGLSLNQLALRTKIPMERLRTLCEDPESEALPEEKLTLSEVLGCEPEYLSNAEYDSVLPEPIAVGDRDVPKKKPPVVSLLELGICTEQAALEHFFHLVQKDGDTLLIRVESARLGMEPGALFFLVAALHRPSDFFAVDLVRMKDGSFRLCGGGLFSPLPKGKGFQWKLPILEVRILPGN